jgi:2-keto-3-deoxy-6-phosphogluconate aldolase
VILEIGLIPTFYGEDVELAKKVASACFDGGAKVVEFIVSPTFNPHIARVCNRYKIPYHPGCITPTEISAAEEAGAEIIKIFPAQALGPNFIKHVLGPMPWSKLMPSGGIGVTKEDIANWIKAGAAAVNLGTNLIRKDLVREGKYNEIKKKVEECIKWIRDAKGMPTFQVIEHIVIYPTEEAEAEKIAELYTKTFNLKREEEQASIMLSGEGGGKIEVIKNYKKDVRAHVAVYVSDFEKACNSLKEKE